MIQASTRFVPHVAVLLAFTAAVALLQGGGRRDHEDCANPAALLPNGDATPRVADANAERHRIGRQQAVGSRGRWIEGSTSTPEDFRLEYTVLHSYEPRRIYHMPGRNLVTEARSRTDELVWVPAGDREIPIHRLRFERSTRSAGPEVVAAYLLVYHGEPVVNPYRAHMAAAVPELWSGRRPMTLYLAHVRAPAARRAQAEAATERWLVERWRNHREACATP